MDQENLLKQGPEALSQLREKLNYLNGCKVQLSEKDAAEDRLEAELELKNKMVQDEIQMANVKRENEIAASFDEQIERQKNRIKKVQEKKEKSKSDKVSQRIESETAELHGDNQRLKQEIKTLFQQGNITRIFNTRLYFALFAPKGFGDIGMILIAFLVALGALPLLLYYLIFDCNNGVGLVILYLIVIAMLAGLYYLVYKLTKLKSPTTIASARAVRFKMRQNNNKIRKIRKKILKDKDESAYNLGEYDEELKDLNQKIADINRQKAEAIAVFKSSTSNILANDVRQKHEKEMADARQQYQALHAECKELEDKIKELSMGIANEYEVYLGKEFMNLANLDKLIALMQDNHIEKISDAIELYNKQIGGFVGKTEE